MAEEVQLAVSVTASVEPQARPEVTPIRQCILESLGRLSEVKFDPGHIRTRGFNLPIRPDSLEYATSLLLHPLLGLNLEFVARAEVFMGMCGYPWFDLYGATGLKVTLVVPCYGHVIMSRFKPGENWMDRVGDEEVVTSRHLADHEFQRLNEAMRWLKGEASDMASTTKP